MQPTQNSRSLVKSKGIFGDMPFHAKLDYFYGAIYSTKFTTTLAGFGHFLEGKRPGKCQTWPQYNEDLWTCLGLFTMLSLPFSSGFASAIATMPFSSIVMLLHES